MVLFCDFHIPCGARAQTAPRGNACLIKIRAKWWLHEAMLLRLTHAIRFANEPLILFEHASFAICRTIPCGVVCQQLMHSLSP